MQYSIKLPEKEPKGKRAEREAIPRKKRKKRRKKYYRVRDEDLENDFEEFETNKKSTEEDSTSSFPSENKRLLVNPDCPIGIIREYIANELLLRGEDVVTFELCTEKGTLVKTSQVLPAVNGLDLLKEKDTYYVILPTKATGSQELLPLLTPLLNKFSKEFIDFMALQKRKSSSLKLRRSTSSKASSKDVNSTTSGSKAALPSTT